MEKVCDLCGLEESRAKSRITEYVESSLPQKEIIRRTGVKNVCKVCKSSFTHRCNSISNFAYENAPQYNGPFLDYIWSKFPGDLRYSNMGLGIGADKTIIMPPNAKLDFEALINYKGLDEVSKNPLYREWLKYGMHVYMRYDEIMEEVTIYSVAKMEKDMLESNHPIFKETAEKIIDAGKKRYNKVTEQAL